MFVLELTYTAPLDRVDEHMADHLSWVKAQYDAGVFLASGRKEPRDGGVIIALGNDRPAMETLLAGDPFVVAGVCDYRVTQFFATTVTAGLERLKESLPSA
ncbi:YciI family protein [Kribbella sp. CA-293567]|uniref:YciI family protein n=1 Tax=Kribbella sp. CA-293567 TaxID=3002436 RepID=UPI0022DDCFF9|nr:YciI family protein [Kribbella sp. CA-293567]WBQ04911.1 YciI family protein [Kribbella sp. CA-293567]